MCPQKKKWLPGTPPSAKCKLGHTCAFGTRFSSTCQKSKLKGAAYSCDPFNFGSSLRIGANCGYNYTQYYSRLQEKESLTPEECGRWLLDKAKVKSGPDQKTSKRAGRVALRHSLRSRAASPFLTTYYIKEIWESVKVHQVLSQVLCLQEVLFLSY